MRDQVVVGLSGVCGKAIGPETKGGVEILPTNSPLSKKSYLENDCK